MNLIDENQKNNNENEKVLKIYLFFKLLLF